MHFIMNKIKSDINVLIIIVPEIIEEQKYRNCEFRKIRYNI